MIIKYWIKIYLGLVIGAICCIGACQKNREENTLRTTTDPTNEIMGSDKIDNTDVLTHFVVSYDSLRRLDSIKNLAFEQVADEAMIDWLFSNSKHSDLRDFTRADRLFTEEAQHYYETYTQVRFPAVLYEKIFPKTTEYRAVQRQFVPKGSSRSRTKTKITSYYGTRVTEERKYSQLYSIHEMKNHIQLIFTAPGKYLPNLYLVTVSKNSLQLIDEKLIYHSFVDAGDTDMVHSIFSPTFDKVNIMHIRNHKNWGKVDTSNHTIIIDDHGQILD